MPGGLRTGLVASGKPIAVVEMIDDVCMRVNPARRNRQGGEIVSDCIDRNGSTEAGDFRALHDDASVAQRPPFAVIEGRGLEHYRAFLREKSGPNQ